MHGRGISRLLGRLSHTRGRQRCMSSCRTSTNVGAVADRDLRGGTHDVDSTLPENSKNVGISFNIGHVSGMSVDDHNLHCEVFVDMIWEKLPDDPTWCPQQYFSNAIDVRRRTGVGSEEEVQQDSCKLAHRRRRHYRITVLGPKDINLQFPFDQHVIEVTLSSTKRDNLVFVPHWLKGRSLTIDPARIVLPDWHLLEVSLTYELTDPSISNSGRTYPLATIRFHVHRRGGKYMRNAGFPLFLICAAALAVFFFELDDLAGRIGLLESSLFCIIACKWIVARFVPPVPSSTLLDYYVLFCLCFTVMLIAQNCALYTVKRNEASWQKIAGSLTVQDLDWLCLYFDACFLALAHIGLLGWCMTHRCRPRVLKAVVNEIRK